MNEHRYIQSNNIGKYKRMTTSLSQDPIATPA